MVFRIASSPYTHNQRQTSRIMLLVLLAAVPGIVVQTWFFGWGTVLQIVLAALTAWATEAAILKLRKQPVAATLKDNSALLTGLLLAVSIPPLAPWWMVVLGTAFAVVIAKQLYGGLGHNPFNPAMIGYVVLLISFPVQMTSWLPSYEIAAHIPAFSDALQMIFTGHTAAGGDMASLRLGIDGVSQATPLDTFKTSLHAGHSVQQVLETALESALAHWLYHDEIWLRGNAKAKAEILLAIARVRHALVLFGGIVPRKATTHLRALLNDADAVLLAADTADEALFRTEVVGAKLALTEWLVQRGWRPFLNEAGEKKIAGSFKRFADIHLSRVAAELRSAVQHLAVEDAADQLPKLSRDIDSVQLLAGAYGDAVAPWLENWQELQRAIEHDDRSVFEYFRRQALAAEPFWLHSGKR